MEWPAKTRMRSLGSIPDLPQDAEAKLDEPNMSMTFAKNLTKIMDNFIAKGNMEVLAQKDNVADIGGSKPHVMFGTSPCLTRCRSGSRGYYSIKKQRFLSINDMCRLQGVPAKHIAGWRRAVSTRQMGQVIGNTIPICLIERVLAAILASMGRPAEDRLGEVCHQSPSALRY